MQLRKVALVDGVRSPFARGGRGDSTVIERLSNEIRAELRRGFLGDDSIAWNNEQVRVEDPPGSAMFVRKSHPLMVTIVPTWKSESAPPDCASFDSNVESRIVTTPRSMNMAPPVISPVFC